MKQASPIIVGIDFSASSAYVLRQAAHASMLTGAPVVAAHVLNAGHLRHWEGSSQQEKAQDVLTEQAKAKLDELAQIEAPHIEVEYEVCCGRPAEELERIVREREASMLIIAANDMTKKRLGSIASRSARTVPCDVLIVRNWQSGNFKRIVVCIDFSDASEHILKKSIEIAASNDAHLEVVHVIYPPGQDVWGESLDYQPDENSPSYPERVRARTQAMMDKTLAPYAAQLEKIKSSTAILESTVPSMALTFHIQDSGADLAVLGTRGRSKLASIFIGTNAERLMHDATVSVLAVRF